MKLGIIREGKVPPDSRVCLTPRHCKQLMDRGIDIVVQPSPGRVYKDEEYVAQGIRMQEDLSDRDILIGVKEVPISMLMPNKRYFFFSHTYKKQVYNRPLLQAVLEKHIELIDYEAITADAGGRLIAFGEFAGVVGAHNGMIAWIKSQGKDMRRMKSFFDYVEAKNYYKSLEIPKCKIALTGTGRVSKGAARVLDDMGIRRVDPIDYVKDSFDESVYTQLPCYYYVKRKDGLPFDDVQHFYKNPELYDSDFHHFVPETDLFINGIYWDNKAPAFFTMKDIESDDFRISCIADVTCDIAPLSSVPTTIRPSTIADPFFGIDRSTKEEVEPFAAGVLNMMTIDNLPNELPRDASDAFGDMFVEHVIPELLKEESSILARATITNKQGELTEPYAYLTDFVNGVE